MISYVICNHIERSQAKRRESQEWDHAATEAAEATTIPYMKFPQPFTMSNLAVASRDMELPVFLKPYFVDFSGCLSQTCARNLSSETQVVFAETKTQRVPCCVERCWKVFKFQLQCRTGFDADRRPFPQGVSFFAWRCFAAVAESLVATRCHTGTGFAGLKANASKSPDHCTVTAT